jgi:hypothetical protein
MSVAYCGLVRVHQRLARYSSPARTAEQQAGKSAARRRKLSQRRPWLSAVARCRAPAIKPHKTRCTGPIAPRGKRMCERARASPRRHGRETRQEYSRRAGSSAGQTFDSKRFPAFLVQPPRDLPGFVSRGPQCASFVVGRRAWTSDSVDHILQWSVRSHALVGRLVNQKPFPISAPVWPIFVTR